MRKSLVYVIINILCAALFVAIFTFAINAEKILYVTLYKNPEIRTIVVSPRYTKDGYNLDGDINELLKLDNVKDAYINAYGQTSVFSPSLRSGYVDGVITLKRFSDEVKVIKGHAIDQEDTSVAICPTVFYTNSDALKIDKKHLKNGYKYLDKEFTITFDKGDTEISKKFKIVGLYRTSDILVDNGTCFVSERDMKEIIDAQSYAVNTSYNLAVSALNVVVDKKENLSLVKEQIINSGFESVDDALELDLDFVNIIHLAPISLLVLVFYIFYLNTENYIYKRKKSKARYLEKVKTSELVKGNVVMFAAGTLLFLVTYLILINKVPLLGTINLMFDIDIIIPIIISIILYLSLPLVIKK